MYVIWNVSTNLVEGIMVLTKRGAIEALKDLRKGNPDTIYKLCYLMVEGE